MQNILSQRCATLSPSSLTAVPNLSQIIIRIHFAVTLFKHSPLTRRAFFSIIMREREAFIINNIKWVRGQHHQYNLGTLAGISINHRKFSSSTTSSFSKECYHHLHQYVLV
jgi:hypothetical protein